eukprot:NODE_4777_length_449_cov_80.382500_g4123_i0.p3 GENE.NODE_4777_length_449_cov_80.382500_g4123_i0~~NODE_4777_length_449_cov_80.382500_g4123_i0.p3  ORF type:complete len:63 (+),score=13.52 NODE_4777_length_449_cov_80.382500_g4123_i0:132-320(+)
MKAMTSRTKKAKAQPTRTPICKPKAKPKGKTSWTKVQGKPPQNAMDQPFDLEKSNQWEALNC